MVKLIPALIAISLVVGACSTVPQPAQHAVSGSTANDATPDSPTPAHPAASPAVGGEGDVVDDGLIAPTTVNAAHGLRLPDPIPQPEPSFRHVSPPAVSVSPVATLISFPDLPGIDSSPQPGAVPPAAGATTSDSPAVTPIVRTGAEIGALPEPRTPPAQSQPSRSQPPTPIQPPTPQPPALPAPSVVRQPEAQPRSVQAEVGPRPVQPPAPIDRTVSATVGEEAVIRLEGTNWLYLGSEPEGVAYRRRRLLDETTEVVLRPDQAGEYRLDFQRHDLLRGEREELSVVLHVSRRNDPRLPVAPEIVGAERGQGTETVDDAEIDAEQVIDPMTAAIATIDTNDPTAVSAAATAALETGNRDLAVALWRRNRDLESQYGREARVGLFETSVSVGRLVDAVSYADLMAEHQEAPPAGALIVLSDSLIRAGDGATAARMIARTLSLRSDPATDDELLFRLARHYETDRVKRNLRRSLGYYRRVAAEFPLSRYWEASRARIEHIERHFFHVR